MNSVYVRMSLLSFFNLFGEFFEMQHVLRLLTTLIFVAGLSSATSAATYNIAGGASGGKLGNVVFDFTISNDFGATFSDTSIGLTINTLTSSVVAGSPFPIAGGLGYNYNSSIDRLNIGGLNAGTQNVVSFTNDFYFIINGFTGLSPSFGGYADFRADSGFISSPFAFAFGSVTEIAPVPLPAGLPLLLAGLGGLAGLRLRKKRISQV